MATEAPSCTCEQGCSTLAEMTDRHGTPREMRSAALRAVPEFLSLEEALNGADKYELEWIAMAQHEEALRGG